MENEKKNSDNSNSVFLKGLVIFILVIVLLIPTFLIQSLISEREARQKEAVYEVSSKWGSSQTLSGPILSIPYIEYYKDTYNNLKKETRFAHFLPDELTINGEVLPEKRYRGIYEIVVYNSTLNVKGKFNPKDFVIPDVAVENIMYNKAFLSFGVSDLRGLEKQIDLKWNEKLTQFNPGVETADVISSGINAPIEISAPLPSELDSSLIPEINFSFNLSLKGSERLSFVPVGKETNIDISSKWSDPSFDGAFLPDERTIDANGFKAHWNVLNLNRNFPQSWTGNRFSIESFSFGVNLIVPADNYQKSTRSVKYAILIILLTFVVFFFVEFLNNKRVHPFAYGLVGAALCIFYVLLISLSEYMSFTYAYLTGAIMTILLITIYIHSILKSFKLSTLISSVLILLYAFIFTIIQIQDYSLLMGSIGLFLVLAILMYFSRKIDWYGTNKKEI